MVQEPSTVIENVEQLKEYLQAAIKLEHATLPPYLTTAYSARIDANRSSIDIIRAVAKEEMLHLTLAANLLNAIGGEPDLTCEDFVPIYPTHLPTGQDDFDVGIEKFSEGALRTFLAIERPTPLNPEHADGVQYITKHVQLPGRHINASRLAKENPFIPITPAGDGKYELRYKIAVLPHTRLTARRRAISEARKSLVPHVPPKSSEGDTIKLHYWNIGEFYKAIHLGFVELTLKMGMKALFTGNPDRQVGSRVYYSAGGESIVVTDLKSALVAIDQIAGQGEGSNHRVYDSEGELAHYYRFDQIRRQQYYRDPNKDGAGDAADDPRGPKFHVDIGAVFPIKSNMKIADYEGHPELMEKALLFNGRYKHFLEQLNIAFNGQPSLLEGDLLRREMFHIKETMERLIHNPIPGSHEHAAPTFEMNQFKYPLDCQKPAPAVASVTPTTVANHV